MDHEKTPVQIGLDVMLVVAIICLTVALFVPAYRGVDVVSIIPFITGAIASVLIGLSRFLYRR